MDFRPLGNTGLSISAISVGTVSLGIEYGIGAPGQSGRPTESEVVYLLQKAVDMGINYFDTAPAYGESERLLGRALGANTGCYVATKVPVFRDADGRLLHGARLKNAVHRSLDNSLRALRRDVIDVCQIHNATVELLATGELTEHLLLSRDLGKVRYLGASVYGEEAALAAIRDGRFDMLQLAYSLLDQRMAERVLPEAKSAGVGVVARSVLLKGALTAKARWLPSRLSQLKHAAKQARDTVAAGSWEKLSLAAIRFCLAVPPISTVLVGVRTPPELAQLKLAADAGPLPDEVMSLTTGLGLTDERLLNPSYWDIP